jgi:AcrR family transcriptional regulator
VDQNDVAERGQALLADSHVWTTDSPATRRAIVAAALETFAARGYHGSTLKDISRGTGMSTAALYVHFASKEELLFEISKRGHEAALEVIELAAASGTSPADALDLLVYTFTRWHAEQRTLAYVVQHEWIALNPEHVTAIQQLRGQIQAVVRKVLQDGADIGQLDVPDLRGSSAALLSWCIDVARWFDPEGPYTPDGLARSYLKLARKLFAPAPTALEVAK